MPTLNVFCLLALSSTMHEEYTNDYRCYMRQRMHTVYTRDESTKKNSFIYLAQKEGAGTKAMQSCCHAVMKQDGRLQIPSCCCQSLGRSVTQEESLGWSGAPVWLFLDHSASTGTICKIFHKVTTLALLLLPMLLRLLSVRSRSVVGSSCRTYYRSALAFRVLGFSFAATHGGQARTKRLPTAPSAEYFLVPHRANGQTPALRKSRLLAQSCSEVAGSLQACWHIFLIISSALARILFSCDPSYYY